MSTIIDPTKPYAAPLANGGPTVAVVRPSDLSGLRVGLLENTKRNAAAILDAVGDHLAARDEGVTFVRRTKQNFAFPLPEDVIEDLAQQCDVVVIGVGDCGSCSASAITDGILLESHGVPTAVVVTEAFTATAHAMASLQGAADYPFLVTAHPVANLDESGVADRGEELAASVRALLIAA